VEAVKKIGIINFLIGAIMAGAPLLGAWMNAVWGWQSTFLLIAIQSIMCVLGIAFLFNECLPIEKRKSLSLKYMIQDYAKLITSAEFMCNNITCCFLIASLVAYTASLSLLFINYLNISDGLYGFYQGAVLATFALASLMTGKLVKRFSVRQICTFSAVGCPLGLGILYTISVIKPDAALLFTIVMSMTTAILSISMGAFGAIIMNCFPEAKGAAGSIMTAIRMIITAGFVGLCSFRFDGTMASLSQTLLVGCLFGMVLYFYGLKREHDESLQLENKMPEEVA
jgi:DHA1 family bicyclomycin/chloramphenicol resistance-like MFS transporter